MASNSPTTWTATGGIAPGTYHFYAILCNSGGTELARSEEMVVEMEPRYAVTPIPNDGNYGTVTSGPIYCTEHVPSAEITATPKSGYVFTSWQLPAGVTLAGGYVPTDATIRVNATAAGTVKAVFAEDLRTGWAIKFAKDEWTEHELLKEAGNLSSKIGYYEYTVGFTGNCDFGLVRTSDKY